MALTIAKQGRTNVAGNRLTVVLKVTLDNAYPLGGAAATNGYAFDAPSLSGIANIESITITGGDANAAAGTSYRYGYDRTNKRLNCFESGHAAIDTSGSSVAANTDQAPFIELPNAATDLNGLVLYITIVGGRA